MVWSVGVYEKEGDKMEKKTNRFSFFIMCQTNGRHLPDLEENENRWKLENSLAMRFID